LGTKVSEDRVEVNLGWKLEPRRRGFIKTRISPTFASPREDIERCLILNYGTLTVSIKHLKTTNSTWCC